MGSLVLATHWENVVLPTIRDYFEHENALGQAVHGPDAETVYEIGYGALRTAMSASIILHHFTDVALERGALTSRGVFNLGEARKLLSSVTTSANGVARPVDLKILGEVADAVKHAELTASHIVHVKKRGRVLALSDEVPHSSVGLTAGVIVVVNGGARSLREIVENVARG